MEPGKIYEIFISDGAIGSEFGLLLNIEGLIKAYAVFLVEGEVKKYPFLWYTFREISEI